MAIRKSILELRSAYSGSRGPAGHIEIEVAGEHDRRVPVVSRGIIQCFVNLGASQSIIPSALEVQVIGNNHFSADVGFAHQRDPSPQTFLERADLGKEPVRAPEI